MAFIDSTVATSATTSVTGTLPAGAGAGDTLVAFVYRGFTNGGDMTASAGWEVQDVLDHPEGVNCQFGIFVAPGDVAALTFTAPAGSGNWYVHILAFSGRNTVTLAEDWDLSTTTGSSASVGSMTATAGADIAVCWADVQDDTSFGSVPAGFTDTETTSEAGASLNMISAYDENISAGATGGIARTASNFTAKFMAGVLLGEPTGGGGGTDFGYIIRL